MLNKLDEELFSAVTDGNSKKVKELIDVFFMKKLIGKAANVNASDEHSNSPLNIAAYRGHKEIVKMLIKAGARLDETDNFGNTVIIEATRKGHADIVRELIAQGADVDSVDNGKYTALMAAAMHGHYKVVVELIKAHADIDAADNEGNTTLSEAIEYGHIEIVRVLVSAGANIYHSNYTDLMIASVLADNLKVKKICSSSPVSEINKKDKCGKSSLMLAVKFNHTSIVKLLLDAGADIDAVDVVKNSPLHIATLNDNVEIAEMLIKAGADVNFKGKFGITPLMQACMDGRVVLVDMLVSNKAFINDKNDNGQTPLMITMNCYHMDEKHLKIVNILLAADANLDLVDEDGNSALIWAAKLGDDKIAKLIIQAGADRDIKNNKGLTALDSARDADVAAILR